MSTITVRQLTKPTDQELDRAAEVLTTAFKEDVPVTAMVGGHDELRHGFHRSVAAAAAVGGALYVASYGDVEIAGAAAWFPPGTDFLSTEEQKNAGYNELVTKFPPELLGWWGEFMPQYEGIIAKYLGDGVKKASWSLLSFGVLKDLQGKGIGTALLRAGEERAKADGTIAMLETERPDQVAMYKHLGYTYLGEGTVDTQAAKFQLVIMSKKP